MARYLLPNTKIDHLVEEVEAPAHCNSSMGLIRDWLGIPERAGDWSAFWSGNGGQIFMFSDPTTAFEFKIRWA